MIEVIIDGACAAALLFNELFFLVLSVTKETRREESTNISPRRTCHYFYNVSVELFTLSTITEKVYIHLGLQWTPRVQLAHGLYHLRVFHVVLFTK